MADYSAEAARRSSPLTDEPVTRYDSKCEEWDTFTMLGTAPTTAAYSEPGRWQLVYELRPLELVPYWLGIPFRPCHPVYAVIYDPVNRGYYTAPAVKIRELGRPRYVRGSVPFARLLHLSVPVGRLMRYLTEKFLAGAARSDRLLRQLEARISAWTSDMTEVKP